MPEFKVEIGPQQIYDKLVQMDEKADARHSEQAVINARTDMRISALEKAATKGWQFWMSFIGFLGGASGALVALLHH